MILFQFWDCSIHPMILFKFWDCSMHPMILFKFWDCSIHPMVLFKFWDCLIHTMILLCPNFEKVGDILVSACACMRVCVGGSGGGIEISS